LWKTFVLSSGRLPLDPDQEKKTVVVRSFVRSDRARHRFIARDAGPEKRVKHPKHRQK
jgi:hypothetical protein